MQNDIAIASVVVEMKCVHYYKVLHKRCHIQEHTEIFMQIFFVFIQFSCMN